MAHTILLNFLVAALVFILISRKLFSFIKARHGGQGVKYKANIIFCGIIVISAVPVVFLTFNEFLMLTAVIMVSYFFRKKLLAFSEKTLSKKNGKIIFAGSVAAAVFVLWFGLALFYRTDFGMPIGVKNYLYHKYWEEFEVSGFFGATVWGHPTNQLTCYPKNGNPQTDAFNVARKNTLSVGSRRFASDNYYGIWIREDYEKYISTFIDDYFDEFKVYAYFDSGGLSNVKYMSDCFDKNTSLEDFLSFQRDNDKMRACNTVRLIIFLEKQPYNIEKENVINNIKSFLNQLSTKQFYYTNIYFAVFKNDSKYSYDFLDRSNLYSWNSVNNWDYSPVYITSIINHEAQISHLHIDYDFFKSKEEN